MHYGWIVAAAIFLALLAAAGVRATPSVLIVPLEQSFGWTRATISLAISINIFLYGLMGPFAAALMQRIGIRRTVAAALALMAATIAASTFISAPWHDEGSRQVARRWVNELLETLQPFGRGAYVNNLHEGEGDRVPAAYGANYARLAAIKRTYDPDNVLRINPNILPV